jgi:hypothetical protein
MKHNNQNNSHKFHLSLSDFLFTAVNEGNITLYDVKAVLEEDKESKVPKNAPGKFKLTSVDLNENVFTGHVTTVDSIQNETMTCQVRGGIFPMSETKDPSLVLFFGLTGGQLLSIVILVVALVSYYRLSKKSLTRQVNSVGQLFYHQKSQKELVTQTRRQWYNLRVKIVYDLTHLPQIIAKKINVKPFPKKFR